MSQRPAPSARSNEATDAAGARLLADAGALVRQAGVFGGIGVRRDEPGGPLLECAAKDSSAPSFFRLAFDGATPWVSLVTADRWLSQSIEADLVHTGDKLEDLLEEELVDQGLEGVRPRVEHFRSEDKLFTFRSPIVPGSCSPDVAAKWILAYEACFRNLGDMAGGVED